MEGWFPKESRSGEQQGGHHSSQDTAFLLGNNQHSTVKRHFVEDILEGVAGTMHQASTRITSL